MKKTFLKVSTTKALGLVLCLAALPLATMVSGCAGDRYHQSTGQVIDDEGITMRVKSALAGDADYKYEGVQVQTFKGTVQLSGFVNTHAQKGRAADLARGVENVRDVENNISIKD